MKLLTILHQVIKGYFYWIKYYLSKSYREKQQREAQRRIEICNSCQYFYKPARNCMLCGCFMDIKTKGHFDLDENGITINGCLEKKW